MTNGNSAEHEEQQCMNPLTCQNAYWEVNHWECPVCIGATTVNNDQLKACNEIAEACRSYAAPQAECAPLDKQEAVASVYQNKIGETYVQFDIENAEDIPVGTKLYLAEPIAPRADAEKDAALTLDEAWDKYNKDCQWGHEPTARGLFEDGWNAAILAATKDK